MTLKKINSVFLLGGSQASAYLEPYNKLKAQFNLQGEFLTFDTHPEWLACYDRDSQSLHARLPLLVFRPHSIDVIGPFVKACFELEIPIKARCGGTSLTGASIACPGGIILLTGHFKKIEDYHCEKGRLVVEPGATPQQINDLVSKDGWEIPLEMAVNGTAGLAGCLNANAKGYHQRSRAIYAGIESIALIDGQGELVTVPPQLICGMEGLLGIITRIELKLVKKAQEKVLAKCQLSWRELLGILPSLRTYQAIKGIIWQNQQFTFFLEGDLWRIAPVFEAFPGLVRLKEKNQFFYPLPARTPLSALSSACLVKDVPHGIERAEELAKRVGLICQAWGDAWDGAVHFYLSCKDDISIFSKKMENFLLLWIEWLELVDGFLISSHGIGKALAPYLPPFFNEEEIRCLKRFQETFDPRGLFVKDHFFPLAGKSVEKVLNTSSDLCN